jgi:hypothetical protein
MTLNDKFLDFQILYYQAVHNFFKRVARFFGYPNNPGMPKIENISDQVYIRSKFFNSLPFHKTSWPPTDKPESWWEVLFGTTPTVQTIPRYIYESKEEGFYNFYIQNYKNMYFLPDWLSEFLQVNLNFCLDLTILESLRESIFLLLVFYSQVVVVRIALGWFILINPYSVPWCYLVAAVDWIEEVFQGIVPSVLGVNLTGSIFLGILGAIADSLNHLVFTMPYLPSEGEPAKILINNKMTDILVFHYLPILWYRYPIPNELRKFWYTERPDILEYLQTAYKNLDVQFLPDNIEVISKAEQFQKIGSLSNPDNNVMSAISTEIISKITENQWIDLNLIKQYWETFGGLFYE